MADPESPCPASEHFRALKDLDRVVAMVVEDLQRLTRDATLCLVATDETFEEKRRLGLPIDAKLLSAQKELQRLVDLYERWLGLKDQQLPSEDPNFQKITWLCGVAHDALSAAIRHTRARIALLYEYKAEWGIEYAFDDLERVRLGYINSIYALIHSCIFEYLRVGNPSAR